MKMGKIIEFIDGCKDGSKLFGETIAVIINSILLTLVYFIGVGLTSITAKLFKKHFLRFNTNEKTKTYWKKIDLTKKPLEEYYRQF